MSTITGNFKTKKLSVQNILPQNGTELTMGNKDVTKVNIDAQKINVSMTSDIIATTHGNIASRLNDSTTGKQISLDYQECSLNNDGTIFSGIKFKRGEAPVLGLQSNKLNS